jgi:Zinc carboxypeptidase
MVHLSTKSLLKSPHCRHHRVFLPDVGANPDGYQYTFDNERLWRKNLRDNDGDGQITGIDGVDPKRNFDEHFTYDEEGSSSIQASLTYRGPSAASEPETRAMQGLLDRIKPKFQSNYHSFGPLILYPQGWQQPGPQRLVHHHQRPPAGGRVPPVPQLGGGQVRTPRRAVRPTHRQQLRLLADRRRVIQAAHPDDQRARRRRHLSFWTSYNTEQAWDHLFVEAHTVGQDNWTTLPDLNGHTSQATGDSCPEGWRTLHPWLDHYQTLNPDNTCSPTGTTGVWHASSGSSNSWQQWSVDLGAYAGTQVEVSLAYVSDWSMQGLGVFVDDIEVSTGEGSASFEDGLAGWMATGPPPGSAPNSNNFIRTTAAGFPEGAAATDDTLYFGFGFEGISGASTRSDVMGRAIDYLLR